MQPPCITPGQAVNPCARRLYDEKVLGHVDLSADWAGWRLRGRWLISPEGDRVNPLRLRGMLFREANDQRRHKAGSRNGQQSAGAKVIQIGAARKETEEASGAD